MPCGMTLPMLSATAGPHLMSGRAQYPAKETTCTWLIGREGIGCAPSRRSPDAPQAAAGSVGKIAVARWARAGPRPRLGGLGQALGCCCAPAAAAQRAHSIASGLVLCWHSSCIACKEHEGKSSSVPPAGRAALHLSTHIPCPLLATY